MVQFLARCQRLNRTCTIVFSQEKTNSITLRYLETGVPNNYRMLQLLEAALQEIRSENVWQDYHIDKISAAKSHWTGENLSRAQGEDVITIMSGHEAARVAANRSGRKTIGKFHLGCGLEQEISTDRSHSQSHHPAWRSKTPSWVLSTSSKVLDAATIVYLECSHIHPQTEQQLFLLVLLFPKAPHPHSCFTISPSPFHSLLKIHSAMFLFLGYYLRQKNSSIEVAKPKFQFYPLISKKYPETTTSFSKLLQVHKKGIQSSNDPQKYAPAFTKTTCVPRNICITNLYRDLLTSFVPLHFEKYIVRS